MVRESKVPHAQLFLGKEGSGTLPLALAYISYILCTDKGEDSCGKCKNCVQSHKMIHPDVHFSFPVVKLDEKKRDETTSDDFMPLWRATLAVEPFMNVSDWQKAMEAETSKPNINVKECSDILRKLGLQSFMDGPKILIMWLPEYLGKEGNRLLKLIEEPTPDTLIIFVAEDQDLILNTVLSRCQLIKVSSYQEHEINQYLRTEIGVSEQATHQITNVSLGNINKALKMAKGDEMDFSESLFDWLRICYTGDALAISSKVTTMNSLTVDQKIQFFDYGLHYLRSFCFLINTGRTNCGMTEKELEVSEKMKNVLDMNKLELIYNILDNSILHIKRNGNFKINFTADCIQIGDILRNRTITFAGQVKFA